MRLSELVCKSRNIEPPKGSLVGKCVFCGAETSEGHKPTFGDSFCNAPYLTGGSVICPECAHMQEGKTYRNSMWVASEKEFQFFKREEARGILLNPPEPPFAIYITRTWKKTGWQAMMRFNGGVATSRDAFPVGFDYDPIYVDRAKLREDLELIDSLHWDTRPQKRPQKDPTKRPILLTKSEIESGKISAGGMAKLLEAGMNVQETAAYLRKRANEVGWALAVYVS